MFDTIHFTSSWTFLGSHPDWKMNYGLDSPVKGPVATEGSIRAAHKFLNIKAYGSNKTQTFTQFYVTSLPALLHGQNGMPLSGQEEVDAALEVLDRLLSQIARPLDKTRIYSRVDMPLNLFNLPYNHIDVALHQEAWEEYARATFLAHQKNIPAEKLRFLQYVDADSADWWTAQRDMGAILIGAEAKRRGLLAGGESAPAEPLPALEDADREFRSIREEIVTTGFKASIAAARALYEIHSYRQGLLWKGDHLSSERYCAANWGFAKAHSYRLVDSGRLIAELQNPESPNGDRLPLNEGQLRPLLNAIPKERQVECWRAIVADKDPTELTGSMVNKEVEKFAKKHGLVKKKKKAAVDAEEVTAEPLAEETRGQATPSTKPGRAQGKGPADTSKLAGKLLGELQAAVSAHPAGREISVHLKAVEARLSAPDAAPADAAGNQVAAQAISATVSEALADDDLPPAEPVEPADSPPPTIEVDCEVLGSATARPHEDPAATTATPGQAPNGYFLGRWRLILSQIRSEMHTTNRKDVILGFIKELDDDMESAKPHCGTR